MSPASQSLPVASAAAMASSMRPTASSVRPARAAAWLDHPQRGGHREVIPAGPGQLQALGRAAHQRVVILQVEGDLRADRQGPPAHLGGYLAGRRAAARGTGRARWPPRGRRRAAPTCCAGRCTAAGPPRRLRAGQRGLQRDAEVAVLGDAAAEHLPAHRPRRLAAVEHRGRGVLDQRQDAVPVPQRQRAGFPGGLEPLGGVLPDRVQQPVPGIAGRLAVQHHQRLVDQRDQQAEDLVGGDGLASAGGIIRADLLGHVQVPAGEHRQPAQQRLLGLVQQLVAPVHGGPQRLLPQRRGPVPGVEQLEPVAQPVRDLLHRQRPHPGRRQLDAQRDPVQGAAQPGHRRRVALGQREPRPGARGPGREQPHRLVSRPARRRGRRRAAGRAAAPATRSRPGPAAAPGWWR